MAVKIQTFGIVHNQNLLIERNFLLSQLENFAWVLVTPNPDTDRISAMPNVFVASQLPNHCEHSPEYSRSMLHYTAWYAIIKNNLIDNDTDFVRLIEWDSVFPQGVEAYKANTINAIETGRQIFGHSVLSMNTCWFKPKHLIELTTRALSHIYHLDLQILSKRSPRGEWLVTTNYVLSKDMFSKYFNYCEKFEPFFANQKQGGNNLERLMTCFCLQFGIEWGIIAGFENEYRNTHGTS